MVTLVFGLLVSAALVALAKRRSALSLGVSVGCARNEKRPANVKRRYQIGDQTVRTARSLLITALSTLT